MRAMVAMTAAAAMLAGCTTAGRETAAAGRPMAIEGDSIRYETSPCFGTCPVYAVTIRPDGSGTFEGQRFTAVTGLREFKATPEQYRRFAAALQPYRPANGEMLYDMGTPLCGRPMVSDMPSVDVRWSEASGGAQHLSLYYGCGTEAMRDAIRAAPEVLPIGAFIKPAAPFPPSR
ncbi:DUF6438 domain-containing protein [Sphingomonas rubra]|uniref:DUF6438 domain-containing protein n=1 Tax=Sphingomonas rubra TaxID=634430 RepID=A0A1I5S8C4_9SPHN|nr:DUF6438 domain-containing protein [Sphingomonas rubra]SFP66847.1 hypothetical protein SAMN04488241_10533 [Sphingomonas rubra]